MFVRQQARRPGAPGRRGRKSKAHFYFRLPCGLIQADCRQDSVWVPLAEPCRATPCAHQIIVQFATAAFRPKPTHCGLTDGKPSVWVLAAEGPPSLDALENLERRHGRRFEELSGNLDGCL